MNPAHKEVLKSLVRSGPLIRRELAEVQALYSMSSDELRSYQQRRFLQVVGAAFEKSSFYQAWYKAHGLDIGDIRSLDDIELLPVLTKDVLKAASQEILTGSRVAVVAANTSGTTGSPLTVFHSYKAIRLEQAYLRIRRAICGFAWGSRLVSVRGLLGVRQLAYRAPLMNTLFLSSYLISEARARDYFEQIESFRPNAIEGYPSSLYNLALVFRDCGLSVAIPICFTSSETLFEFQRAVIESVFRTKVFDFYGCTERVVALSELPGRVGYFEDPGYSVCEFKDDSVIATSLINDSFPLIRYQLSDVVTLGQNGEVQSISGRAEDVVVCHDGTRLGRLDHLFKDATGVDLAQIVQRRVGHIDVNVVLSPGGSEDVLRRVLMRLRQRASAEMLDVSIRAVDRSEIIYSARGKYSLVRSYA